VTVLSVNDFTRHERKLIAEISDFSDRFMSSVPTEFYVQFHVCAPERYTLSTVKRDRDGDVSSYTYVSDTARRHPEVRLPSVVLYND